MWLKYKHKFADGDDNDWAWIDLGDDPYHKEDMIRELEDEYSWSEHYRGLKYELLKYPPQEVLLDKIQYLAEEVKSKKEYLDYLIDLYQELYEKNKDGCMECGHVLLVPEENKPYVCGSCASKSLKKNEQI